jgi:hypothetical protein
MKTFNAVLFLWLISLNCAGQNQFNLPQKDHFKTAKVSLNDFTKYQASNLHILTDSIEFTDKITYHEEKISLLDVNYLRVQIGNKVPEFALYGAICGVLISLYAIADASLYGYSANIGVASVVMIVGFTAAGGLIGLMVPKWKTYYINNPTGLINSIKPELLAGRNSLGLRLTFTLNN